MYWSFVEGQVKSEAICPTGQIEKVAFVKLILLSPTI